jgi:hypothetical protein
MLDKNNKCWDCQCVDCDVCDINPLPKNNKLDDIKSHISKISPSGNYHLYKALNLMLEELIRLDKR